MRNNHQRPIYEGLQTFAVFCLFKKNNAIWRNLTIVAIAFTSGCGTINQTPVPQALTDVVHKVLVVKNTHNGQVVCLVKAVTNARNDDNALLNRTLNELCSSYQNGETSFEQYRGGIIAATPLLLAAKAGAYVLAFDTDIDKKLFGDLVSLIRPIDGMETLCNGIISIEYKQNQPITRLCVDAFGKYQ
ncbi:MAG: hypothetical protein PHY16_10950 [Methylobacter sp.]|nr:hypothetical protein [Methylobacter sp.]